MKANWMSETLCSFGEKTRIELGPQLVELKCTDANLKDTVTAPHYQIGKIDALGRVIMPERMTEPNWRPNGAIAEGEMMTCVDWREKHKPKVWKIYQWKKEKFPTKEMLAEVIAISALKDGEEKTARTEILESVKAQHGRFIQVGEDESKADALDFAKALAGEM